MRFDEPTAIAGPIAANLFVASSAPDTELFVQLIDRVPDGSMLYLNRGMLRASHRAIDESPSRLMLPLIGMDQVQGFEPPAGPCAYHAMRCIAGADR